MQSRVCNVSRRRRVLRQLSAVSLGFCLLLPSVVRVASAGNDEPSTAAANEQPGFEETWQVAYIGKSRVGYLRSTTSRKQHEGTERIVTESEMSMAITRFGQPIKIKTLIQTEETLTGDMLQYRFELLNPPAAPTRKSGRVENDRLIVETEIAGKTIRSEQKWDTSIKAPGYQERMLRESPLKPGETRTLQSFEPFVGKLNKVTLTAGGEEVVELLGGQSRKLLKVSMDSSIAPGTRVDEFLDSQGEALKTSTSLLGIGMTTYRVTRELALQSLSGEETDLAVATLVKTGKIDRPYDTRRVVYRVTIPGEDPAKILPSGASQQIESVDGDTVDLTVSKVVPTKVTPPKVAATVPNQAAAVQEKSYREPNNFIQSDDAQVQKLAAQAVGDETDPWTMAKKLEAWVYENLKKKNFSTLLASAAEVAKDLQGDCTEHAVLLAAMARARKIPSRVVVGLVYVASLSSFGGHMWTEVEIAGQWIPIDATLGRGGIGAAHIKFADSSFSDDDSVAPLSAFLPLVSVLGKLQIEVRQVDYR
ncbi:MAG: hypothetical protein EXS05_03625 [Planctomycetaceae bacterium]|nr:hypothetical protein [Planctomycetaceae bacterium]